MPLKYTVSADHVSPRFTFVRHPAVAKEAPGRPGFWYATADNLGCSKDYATADAAVRSLFQANACTNIRLYDAGYAHD